MKITNSRAKAMWIHYEIEGVPKKVFLKGNTSIEVSEVTHSDQLNLNSIDEGLIDNINKGKNYKNISKSERVSYSDKVSSVREPIIYIVDSVTKSSHNAVGSIIPAYTEYRFILNASDGDIRSTFEEDKGLEIYKDGILFLTIPNISLSPFVGNPLDSYTAKTIAFDGTKSLFAYSLNDLTYDLNADYTIKTVY